MWCRLITGENTGAAQTISWQRAGASAASPAASQPGNLYHASGPEQFSDSHPDQMERRIADAYRSGLKDGEVAATQKMSEQMRTRVEQLSRSIEQLALHRTKIQREAEPELVRLSLAIARRILRRELTVDPESLLGLLKAGLEKVESSEVHRVRVHPEHAGVLVKLLEGSARPVAISADPGLPVGGVIFETSRGSLDAGLETQLREIERGFADIYPR